MQNVKTLLIILVLLVFTAVDILAFGNGPAKPPETPPPPIEDPEPSPSPKPPSSDSGYLANHLQAGDRLRPGQYLFSENGEYRFFLKTGGDMVLKDLGQDKILWRSRTGNTRPAYLILKPHGNLVLVSKTGKRIWESKTSGSFAKELLLRDDGALVLHKNGKVVWGKNQSGSSGGNQKPVVQFVEPAGGIVSADLGVTVEAWDPDGTISSVVLWLDDTIVRADDQAPFAWGTADGDEMDGDLLDLSPGTHQLRAVATDDQGAKASVSLSVRVKEEDDEPSTDDPQEDFTVAIADTRYSEFDTPVYTINAVAQFNADNTGRNNAAPAIQKALNAAAANNGGIVYLPRGRYLIKNRLVIPGAVTLRGDWKRPTNADKTVKGTVLYIVLTRGRHRVGQSAWDILNWMQMPAFVICPSIILTRCWTAGPKPIR